MESDINELEKFLNELILKRLIIILKQVINNNNDKNIYEFYNIFKLIVLKQTIYENKYFNHYMRLYALRNVVTKSSLLLNNRNNFKKIYFKDWNFNTKINIIKNNLKKNQSFSSQFLEIKKINILRKIVLNLMINSINNKYNTNKTKKYALLLLRHYAFLIDNYYIKAITITKEIFNYVRLKLKPYKAKFFSIIDYYLSEEDLLNVYKYTLINYLKDNFNFIGKNKKDKIFLLMDTYNKSIVDYDILIKNLSKENNLYILLYKSIFNVFLINKDISLIFSKWKKISFDESFIYNFQAKDKLTNNLIFSKIYLFILVIKKRIKFYFELLYNNIYRKQINGLILVDSYELYSILNFESLYDNYLFNILKGFYKLQNFKNIYNSRIFNMNNKNKKLVSLNIWKNNNNIICNYINKKYNSVLYKQIDIIKGLYIFDKIYILSYNNKIINIIKALLNYYYFNQNKKYIFLKLKIFFKILQTSIINKRKKIILQLLFKNLKLSVDEKILKNKLFFVIKTIQNIFSIRDLKYKTYFFQRVINYYNNIKLTKSYLKSQYNKINNASNKINNNILDKDKLLGLNKILKYFINNSIKNNIFYTLKNTFNNWSLLIGHCPRCIRDNQRNSFNMDSEEEYDIISQKKELKELQKCLKEDQDFHHDLKAKIIALEEENNFVCEKIFEITERVEKCEKCSNLLRSSNISDNNIKSSYGSMVRSIHGNNKDNIPQKSRNMSQLPGNNSSGLNFTSGGTELVPRKPLSSMNVYEEASDPGSDQMDDIDENQNDFSNNVSNPYLIGLKQKIIDLKQEKEPIVNKLKEEIKALYLELNMS